MSDCLSFSGYVCIYIYNMRSKFTHARVLNIYLCVSDFLYANYFTRTQAYSPPYIIIVLSRMHDSRGSPPTFLNKVGINNSTIVKPTRSCKGAIGTLDLCQVSDVSSMQPWITSFLRCITVIIQ